VPFKVAAPPAPMTFERTYDRYLSAFTRIVPTVGGFFFLGPSSGASSSAFNFCLEVYSTKYSTWMSAVMSAGTIYGHAFGIGDGANFGIKNWDDIDRLLLVMRAGYSKPNQPPEVGTVEKAMLVLEVSEMYYIGVDVEDLEKTFGERGAVEEGHPYYDKTLEQLIEEDVEDKMGYEKYLDVLHAAGYCLGRSRSR